MLRWFKKMRQAHKLLLILENNDFFLGTNELTKEDKKNLSILYTQPAYKSLVKLWDIGILSLQRNVLTEGSTGEDITTFNWVLKIQNLLKSNVFHYHKSYADPKKWQSSTPEGIVEDIQALQTITAAYAQSKSDGR